MAGPYYVRSTDGLDADDGLTWATAKATVAGALAVAAAGERIWVSQNHAETAAAPTTWTSAGTTALPVEILCGNDAAQPPTALATTATVSTTGSNAISFLNFAYVYGITFTAGSAAAATSIVFTQNAAWGWKFDTCALRCGGTGAGNRIDIGGTGSGSVNTKVEFVNTNVQFAAASHGIRCFSPLDWRGGALTLGVAPTGGLIINNGGATTIARLTGVDLTNLGTNAIVGWGAASTGGRVGLENCKLAAGFTATTGTNLGAGNVEVWLDNCDSTDTQVRFQHHSYEGLVSSETVIVRTGGASNGTTPNSYKMVSSATRRFTTPLYSPEFWILYPTTGSSKTATVEIVHDSVTALTDAEVWLEIEYLGTSGFPLSLFASDRKTTIIATAANQASSSVAWTTTGITNVNKQKLDVTFTPQEIGIVRARVALAKPSYTVYVDPLLTIA